MLDAKAFHFQNFFMLSVFLFNDVIVKTFTRLHTGYFKEASYFFFSLGIPSEEFPTLNLSVGFSATSLHLL